MKNSLIKFLANWIKLDEAAIKNMTYRYAMQAPSISKFEEKHPELKEDIKTTLRKAIEVLTNSMNQKVSEQKIEEAVRILLANYRTKLSISAFLHCFYLLRSADATLYGKEDLYFSPQKLSRWVGLYWNELSRRKTEAEVQAASKAKKRTAVSEEILKKIRSSRKKLAIA